jgi:hypothetical protein
MRVNSGILRPLPGGQPYCQRTRTVGQAHSAYPSQCREKKALVSLPAPGNQSPNPDYPAAHEEPGHVHAKHIAVVVRGPERDTLRRPALLRATPRSRSQSGWLRRTGLEIRTRPTHGPGELQIQRVASPREITHLEAHECFRGLVYVRSCLAPLNSHPTGFGDPIRCTKYPTPMSNGSGRTLPALRRSRASKTGAVRTGPVGQQRRPRILSARPPRASTLMSTRAARLRALNVQPGARRLSRSGAVATSPRA